MGVVVEKRAGYWPGQCSKEEAERYRWLVKSAGYMPMSVLCNALLCSQPNRTVSRKDGTSAGKRLLPSRWQAQVCEMVMKKKGFAVGKK